MSPCPTPYPDQVVTCHKLKLSDGLKMNGVDLLMAGWMAGWLTATKQETEHESHARHGPHEPLASLPIYFIRVAHEDILINW